MRKHILFTGLAFVLAGVSPLKADEQNTEAGLTDVGRAGPQTRIYTDTSGLNNPVALNKIAPAYGTPSRKSTAQNDQTPVNSSALDQVMKSGAPVNLTVKPVPQAAQSTKNVKAVNARRTAPERRGAGSLGTANPVSPPISQSQPYPEEFVKYDTFTLFDNDGDKVIKVEEFFLGDLSPRYEDRFKQLDANNDGVLDQMEFQDYVKD